MQRATRTLSFLLSTFFLIITPSSADWVFIVESSEDVKYYYNDEDIQSHSDFNRVWIKTEHRTPLIAPSGRGSRVTKKQTDFHRTRAKWRIFYMVTEFTDGSRELCFTEDIDMFYWVPLVPDTAGYEIWKVCSKLQSEASGG